MLKIRERTSTNSFGCRTCYRQRQNPTISPLAPMDLVLVGSNLPHDWQAAHEARNNVVDAIVVQFRDDFNGPGFVLGWLAGGSSKTRKPR